MSEGATDESVNRVFGDGEPAAAIPIIIMNRMPSEQDPYGFELILDLHHCDSATFNRKSLRKFFKKLCDVIDMEPCKLCFWDDVGVAAEERQTSPHTKGTSAVQFILTSNITVHTLDILQAVYINIFSCKSFDQQVAEKISRDWFCAKDCRSHFIERI